MMNRILLVAAALLLGACTHPAAKEFQDWGVGEKLRAERGEIKWSEYYKEAYSRAEKLPNVPGKAENMEWANFLIQAAQMYESGAMSKDQFEDFRRTIQIQQEKFAQTQRAAAGRAFGEAMQNYGNTVYGPEATRARQIPTTPVPRF